MKNFNGGNDLIGFDSEEMAKNLLMQAQVVYQHAKDIKEIYKNIKVSEDKIMKVGSFMLDFYNEYREHDALTMAQCKEMKEAQHQITSEITRILAPRLEESRKRGSEYLMVWNKVNKGIWSIYKRNVNGVNIPYDRTPKVKFDQALNYLKSLTVADYLAYRDARWSDIKKFEFEAVLDEEKTTIEKVIGNANGSNEDNGSAMLLV